MWSFGSCSGKLMLTPNVCIYTMKPVHTHNFFICLILVTCITKAFFLAHLVHGAGKSTTSSSSSSFSLDSLKDPKSAERTDALIWALATIIWRSSRHTGRAVVALNGSSKASGNRNDIIIPIRGIKPDGVTEKVRLYSFDQEEVSPRCCVIAAPLSQWSFVN